jgi:hypothetical protein
MWVNIELIGGLVLGIEHVTGEDDDFFVWAVPIHLGFARIIFIKLKDEE